LASSDRDGQLTSNVPMPEDWSSTRPLPSRSEPFQVVVALRVVAMDCTVGDAAPF
jgi:hypothetical protein